ncbi:hypothetical protein JKF63_06362 [Porcisia hertigi]|uniref:Uncharacterized protein n=1 Tax=Porcisia hertigi TaxID=2761500 RepID=A0A836INM7_9TRYP|nr:hypothetical protein JKF63_06362 [Porcisia hertigi]
MFERYSSRAHVSDTMNSWTTELRRAHQWLLADDTYRHSLMKCQRLLEHLEGDAMLEILKFAPSNFRFTLAAVSPKARLFGELLESPLSVNIRLLFDDTTVMHELLFETVDASASQTLDMIAWWVEKCGIPVSIRASETALRVLASPRLGPIVRGVSLSDLVRACPIPADVALHLERIDMCGEAFASLPVNPSQMAQLRELHVSRCTRATFLHLCQLRGLTTLSIESQHGALLFGNASGDESPQDNLDGVGEVDMHLSASAGAMQHLRLSGSGLSLVTGFDSCKSLETIAVVNCTRLVSLSSLAHTVNLRSLSLSWCGVRDLRGLATCPCLERISIDTCTALDSFAALAGAPRLREVDVFCSGVRDLTGLASCPSLETLRMPGCRLLTDLSPLAGAPRLRLIDASFSAVDNLQGLAACPSLEVLRLDACVALHDLNPLTDAPRLKCVFVRGLSQAALLYPPSLEPKLFLTATG